MSVSSYPPELNAHTWLTLAHQEESQASTHDLTHEPPGV